jgi:hypothetical protein
LFEPAAQRRLRRAGSLVAFIGIGGEKGFDDVNERVPHIGTCGLQGGTVPPAQGNRSGRARKMVTANESRVDAKTL